MAKADTEIYTAAVKKFISGTDTDIDILSGFDMAVRKVISILDETAKSAASKSKKAKKKDFMIKSLDSRHTESG